MGLLMLPLSVGEPPALPDMPARPPELESDGEPALPLPLPPMLERPARPDELAPPAESVLPAGAVGMFDKPPEELSLGEPVIEDKPPLKRRKVRSATLHPVMERTCWRAVREEGLTRMSQNQNQSQSQMQMWCSRGLPRQL